MKKKVLAVLLGGCMVAGPFIGLTANWQQIITGFVLIAAVLIDIFKRKKEAA